MHVLMCGRKSLPLLFCFLAGSFLVVSSSAGATNSIAAPLTVQSQNPAPDLVAHKALYDVRLISTKTGSQMVNISGKMYYEWKPSCEGWITNHRFSLDYEYADSPAINISSDFSTFEGFNGKSINFSSRRRRDVEIYEELRGNATLGGKDGSGKAIYSIPENLTFNLTPETMFPTQHTLHLLENARQGKKFYNVRIFDGSDNEGPVDINSFIGTRISAEDGSVARKAPSQKENGFKPASVNAIDKTLINTPGWNVRMAFFPANDLGSSSDYELSMVFHENGIISDMVIEYGDFTVSQKLLALEKVTPETCKN